MKWKDFSSSGPDEKAKKLFANVNQSGKVSVTNQQFPQEKSKFSCLEPISKQIEGLYELDDDIPISATDSDTDHAVVESSGGISVIEEAATDEDLELIPFDDTPLKIALDFEDNKLKRKSTNLLKGNQIHFPYSDTYLNDLSDKLTSSFSMAYKENIPLIAITPDDDFSDSKPPMDIFPSPISESLTEGIISEKQSSSNKFGTGYIHLSSNRDDVPNLTEAESLEGSDEDTFELSEMKCNFELDKLLDFEGTFEELVKISGSEKDHSLMKPKRILTRKLVDRSLSGKANLVEDSFKDMATDLEDIVTSDDDLLSEKLGAYGESNFLDKIGNDNEIVEISDTIKHLSETSPVRSITPDECSQLDCLKSRKHKKGKFLVPHTIKTKSKSSNKYSSVSRSLSSLHDHTDIEELSSDSESEMPMKKGTKYFQKRSQFMKPQNFKHDTNLLTDVEDLECSEDEASAILSSDNHDSKTKLSKLCLQSTGSKHLKVMQCDKLSVPSDCEGILTDVEDYEGSEDEVQYQEVEETSLPAGYAETYGSLIETHHSVEKAPAHKKYKELVVSEEENVEIDRSDESTDEEKIEKSISEDLLQGVAYSSSESHVLNGDHTGIFFVSQKTNGCQQYVGDQSSVSDCSDSSFGDKKRSLMADKEFSKVPADITDTEDFEGHEDDEFLRQKCCKISNEAISCTTEPNQEVAYIKSGKFDFPVVTLTSTSDPNMLYPTEEFGYVLTDTEDLYLESLDEINTFTLPIEHELPDVEGEIVESREMLKQKSRTVSLGIHPLNLEPATDTEELILETGVKKRKSRAKGMGSKTKESVTDTEDLHISTEVEDALLSDEYNEETLAGLNQRHVQTLNPLNANQDSKTDIEDIDISETEADNLCLFEKRPLSVTPDIMKEMDMETIILKEGDGPFPSDIREKLLSGSSMMPIISLLEAKSSNFDIQHAMYTDTEDLVTSADEEPTYSRAETATPLEMTLDMDEHLSSVVHVQHTRKFDIESPHEAIHVKGSIHIHESNTDVEDIGFSEEEHNFERIEDSISVTDTEKEVCVCVSSTSSEDNAVCVCVGKNQAELSMVWKNKDTNLSTSHSKQWNCSGEAEGTPTVELPFSSYFSNTAPLEDRNAVVPNSNLVSLNQKRYIPSYYITVCTHSVRSILMTCRSLYNMYLVDIQAKMFENFHRERNKNNIMQTTHLKLKDIEQPLYINTVGFENTYLPGASSFDFDISLMQTSENYTTLIKMTPSILQYKSHTMHYVDKLATIEFSVQGKTRTGLANEVLELESVIYNLDLEKCVNISSCFSNLNRKKSKQSAKLRALSENIIFPSSPLVKSGSKKVPIFSRGRSGSVSKLISKFEKFTLTDNTTITQSINNQENPNKMNPVNQTYTHDDMKNFSIKEIFSNDVINDSAYNISFTNDNHLRRNLLHNQTLYEELCPFDTKPIVRIVCLKDRSISPCRLDPARIQDSPAFKVFSKTTGIINSIDYANKAMKEDTMTNKASKNSDRLLEEQQYHIKETATKQSNTELAENFGNELKAEEEVFGPFNTLSSADESHTVLQFERNNYAEFNYTGTKLVNGSISYIPSFIACKNFKKEL